MSPRWHQVFLPHRALVVDDHRAARRPYLPHGLKLVLDDGLARGCAEQGSRDSRRSLPPESSSSASISSWPTRRGAGAAGREWPWPARRRAARAAAVDLVVRIVDQLDGDAAVVAGEVGGPSTPRRASLASFEGAVRSVDHLVDRPPRWASPTRMRGRAPPAELLQIDFLAEGDEGREHVLEVHRQRAAAIVTNVAPASSSGV